MDDVIDNAAEHRFELTVEGLVAYADYRLQGSDLYIDYVFAPVPLRGTGASDRLMKGVLAQVTARQLNIIPVCGYAAAWLRRQRSKS